MEEYVHLVDAVWQANIMDDTIYITKRQIGYTRDMYQQITIDENWEESNGGSREMCPELVPVAGGPIASYRYYPYHDDLPTGKLWLAHGPRDWRRRSGLS